MATAASDLRAAAIEAATAIVADRYPAARLAIAGGSIMRGEGRSGSDIDLVVVFDHVEAAWRESFRMAGFPVEAFVHDGATLNWFIDADIDSGRPAIVQMIAEGEAVGGDASAADALRGRARALLAAGPAALGGERLDRLRYQITDLCDDLRDQRSSAEMRAIGAALHQPLADLILLGRRRWTGSAKWVPRLIRELNDALFQNYDLAFQAIGTGDAAPLIGLAESELAHHGGPLFEGDRRVASPGARRN